MIRKLKHDERCHKDFDILAISLYNILMSNKIIFRSAVKFPDTSAKAFFRGSMQKNGKMVCIYLRICELYTFLSKIIC